jgi:hypothetical protein
VRNYCSDWGDSGHAADNAEPTRLTQIGHAILVFLVSQEHGNVRGLRGLTDRCQSYPIERPMNLRVIFAACTIASFGLSMVTFDALGQQQLLKEQLVGTWTLLSWEQKKGDGTKVERYGTSPKGIAFFDAAGRYIITVMRSDRAKYASNALWQGTVEENKETADGTITYFGTYSISEADGSIAIHIEGSSFPNWNGTDQKRFVAIMGDQLTLIVRPPGGDAVDVIWKRAK